MKKSHSILVGEFPNLNNKIVQSIAFNANEPTKKWRERQEDFDARMEKYRSTRRENWTEITRLVRLYYPELIGEYILISASMVGLSSAYIVVERDYEIIIG